MWNPTSMEHRCIISVCIEFSVSLHSQINATRLALMRYNVFLFIYSNLNSNRVFSSHYRGVPKFISGYGAVLYYTTTRFTINLEANSSRFAFWYWFTVHWMNFKNGKTLTFPSGLHVCLLAPHPFAVQNWKKISF